MTNNYKFVRVHYDLTKVFAVDPVLGGSTLQSRLIPGLEILIVWRCKCGQGCMRNVVVLSMIRLVLTIELKIVETNLS